MHNADLSYGDSSFDMKDIRQSIGRSTLKRGERIQAMTKSHRTLAGTWRANRINGVKIITKTNRRVDDAAIACVRHGNI